MAPSRLDRRKRDRLLMAWLAVAALMTVRHTGHGAALFWGELAATAVACAAGWRWPRLSAAALVLIPTSAALIGRLTGGPIALEMTAIGTFATLSLALAIAARTSRTAAMSVVASGFVVLFSTAINDDPRGIAFAVIWMALCVWHLVANHWERIGLCFPESVRPAVGVRPAAVLAAVLLCTLAGLAVRHRVGPSQRFAWGFMPVSGGSRWSDPAARSGVGSGDAAVAARNHAESFGAVDSNLFLESTETTLFDMFSDSIGQPKRDKKWEPRQGMTPDKLIEAHQRTVKSERGGRSFTTDRMPPQKHQPLEDAAERAVLQWSGPSGMRLAMHRYDTFDGVDWTQSADNGETRLTRRVVEDAVWFFDPAAAPTAGRQPDRPRPVAWRLNVMRLNSNRIPSPALVNGIHIRDIDRRDFFALDRDGCWFMPGRDRVPPLTVVHLAAGSVWEDELWQLLPGQAAEGDGSRTGELASGESAGSTALPPATDQAVATLVHGWTAGLQHPYAKLKAITEHLREDFVLDRSAAPESDDPLGEFLRRRRGGEHLFATAAAMMLSEVGLQARLVTGFYVSPDRYDLAAGHTPVLPEDVHVWVEARLDDHRWFVVEPSPGYQPPVYTPSLGLRLRRFAVAAWPWLIATIAIASCGYATRLIWIDWLLRFGWLLARPFAPRLRLRLAMAILGLRGRIAGVSRSPGRPQRDWLLELGSGQDDLGALITRVCDAADRLSWRGLATPPDDIDLGELLRRMDGHFFRQVFTLRKTTTGASA